MSSNSYQQNLDKNTRTGFVILMMIVTALLSFMTIFALFYQVHQKEKAAPTASKEFIQRAMTEKLEDSL